MANAFGVEDTRVNKSATIQRREDWGGKFGTKRAHIHYGGERWNILDERGNKVGDTGTYPKIFGFKAHYGHEGLGITRWDHGGVGDTTVKPRHRNKGYSTDARIARTKESRHKRIYSSIDNNNKPSIRSAEKAGGKPIRTVTDKDGKERTVYLHKGVEDPRVSKSFVQFGRYMRVPGNAFINSANKSRNTGLVRSQHAKEHLSRDKWLRENGLKADGSVEAVPVTKIPKSTRTQMLSSYRAKRDLRTGAAGIKAVKDPLGNLKITAAGPHARGNSEALAYEIERRTGQRTFNDGNRKAFSQTQRGQQERVQRYQAEIEAASRARYKQDSLARGAKNTGQRLAGGPNDVGVAVKRRDKTRGQRG